MEDFFAKWPSDPTVRKIFTCILEEFEKTGGRVAIGSTTFQLKDAPAFDIRITKETK